MASGKVKWFDNKRGFGFIAGNEGKDVFVHHSEILGRGYKTLAQGEWVTFDLVDSGKGPKAAKVQRLRANAERPSARRSGPTAGGFPSTPDSPSPRLH
jgi:CspA family cold shock protein